MCIKSPLKKSENMADMEENYAEVRQVTCHKMTAIEEKAEEMACEMRRKLLMHESVNEKGEGRVTEVSCQGEGESKTLIPSQNKCKLSSPIG